MKYVILIYIELLIYNSIIVLPTTVGETTILLSGVLFVFSFSRHILKKKYRVPKDARKKYKYDPAVFQQNHFSTI